MSFVETLFEYASKKDLELANKLILETGLEDADLLPWLSNFYFNSHVKNPEMSIRAVIRETLLKKIGFDMEGTYPPQEGRVEFRNKDDQIITAGNFWGDSIILDELIGKPSYRAYDWDHIKVWMLGNFEKLVKNNKSKGFFSIPECGVVLFSDEVEALSSGKKAEIFHAAGVEGYLMETKVVYKVIEGNLTRIVASFSD